MKNKILSSARSGAGFTLTELVVVIAALVVLFGLINITLINVYRRPLQTGANDVLIADMRSQQAKAMTGNANAGAISSYGIYFGTTSYTLFRGSIYSPGDSGNFVVNLSPGFQFTGVAFPSSQVVFQKGSGEVSLWVAGSDSITINDIQGGNNKTIRINKYGATY